MGCSLSAFFNDGNKAEYVSLLSSENRLMFKLRSCECRLIVFHPLIITKYTMLRPMATLRTQDDLLCLRNWRYTSCALQIAHTHFQLHPPQMSNLQQVPMARLSENYGSRPLHSRGGCCGNWLLCVLSRTQPIKGG